MASNTYTRYNETHFKLLTFMFPAFTNSPFYVIIEIIVTNQGQSRQKMNWNQTSFKLSIFEYS